LSTRKERIEQDKPDRKAGHYEKEPGDEIEIIQLPDK
jgi:hypothetical protein